MTRYTSESALEGILDTPRSHAGVALRVLRCVAALVLVALVAGPAARPASAQDPVQRYNAIRLSEHARLLPPDDDMAGAFADFEFVCRSPDAYLPEEPPAARAAFARFIAFARALKDPDAEGKRRRMQLLDEARAAGGWRAAFFDAMWALWLDPRGPEAPGHFDYIASLAEQGNPVALDAYRHWTGDMRDDPQQRIVLLKAAIERGSADAMSTVGFDLATRTRELRPLGVRMLECAAAQGQASAYEGLARVAWLEGRWVDAYRAWQQGANLGDDRSLDAMEDAVLARADYSPETGTRGREPRVAALRAFYEDQFLFNVSHLLELRANAPPAMHLRWSDEAIVRVIDARIRRFGIP